MKTIFILLVGLLVMSCASDPAFVKEKVCSPQSLSYLQKTLKFRKHKYIAPLSAELLKTQTTMQTCYEAYRARTGKDEFNTCLVVGVDSRGRTEFFNLSSQEVPLDREFLNCAHRATKPVKYGRYGRNYVMVQAYQFYYQ